MHRNSYSTSMLKQIDKHTDATKHTATRFYKRNTNGTWIFPGAQDQDPETAGHGA